MSASSARPKLLFFVTEDWYFCSHRLPLARAARDAGYDVRVACRVAAHGDIIRAEGFGLIPLQHFNRSIGNPVRELASLLEIVGIYRREKPDLIHQIAIKPALLGSLAARLTRVPVRSSPRRAGRRGCCARPSSWRSACCSIGPMPALSCRTRKTANC
jgi:hypothetical protein